MIKVILISAAAGIIGTLIGGVLGIILGKFKTLISPSSLFAGGFMLALVSFELLPDALYSGTLLNCSISFIVGVVLVMIVNFIFSKTSFAKNNQSKVCGLIIFIAISIHNFPEGLAIGGGEVIGIGVSVALLIAIHNIPEGVAMIIPLANEQKWYKSVLLCILAGLPMCLGGIVGNLISKSSATLISFCLSIAAGSMAYVTFSEIIPIAIDKDSKHSDLIAIPIGFLVGMIICNVI